MNKIIIIFILSIFAFANDLTDKFDKEFYKSNIEKKIKIYTELKQAYVSSIIRGGNDLLFLERLIKAAKDLRLDYKIYEKELKRSKLFLLDVKTQNNKLILKFSRDIRKNDFLNTNFNSNDLFRDIYDFNAILRGKKQSYKNLISDEIKISQFDKQKLRIVFVNKNKNKIKYDIMNNLLIFSADNLISKNINKSLINKVSINKSKFTNKIIVIDAGHGGHDPGAISYDKKRKEKVITLKIALKLGKILEKQGYKIYYTRKDDKFINLRNRTKFANDKKADLFISIHVNSAPNKIKAKELHGFEIFFLSPARSKRSQNAAALENKSDLEEMSFFSKQTFLHFLNREKIISSNKLSIDISRAMLKILKPYNTADGGVREAPFWVLVGALMPAVLIETGYITNNQESILLYSDKYQSSLAQGISNGINSYFKHNQ